ncbi:MAG: hypothetical protein JWP91_1675 [Fibrobacteres bacterium]|nr:hypothetical protein [Fibrobacterota bacterium]
MIFLEKYRSRLAPLKSLLKPGLWKGKREEDALISADLAKIAPFYAQQAKPASIGKTVFFASTVPLPFALKFEGLFSRMFALRGWDSFCVMDIHQSAFTRRYHGELFGNPLLRITDFINGRETSRIESLVDEALSRGPEAVSAFTYNGSMAGVSALSSVSTGDGTGSVDLGNPVHAAKVRTLLIRSCLYTDACSRMILKHRPNLVMTIEKGGVGLSELFFQCVRHGIDFVQWSGCHDPESLMYKRYTGKNLRSHPFSVSKATWSHMIAKPWDETYRETVLRQFEDGYGNNKWFQYKKLTDSSKMAEKEEMVARLGLDPSKKIAVIFSHILNDANLFYGEDLFKGGFREWLVETVRAAAGNPNVNWLVKLHPANTYRRANMGYTGEFGEILAIKAALGSIPANLKIIYPDDPANPLSWFRALDYAITVRGTVGAEIPCFGKRMLTAGTGRYSGLGFTDDSSSIDDYLAKIRGIESLPPISEEQIRMALRHAYLFFKVRPTPYRTYANDAYEFPQGHPYNRDVVFKVPHYGQLTKDAPLSSLMDWLTESDDEDFLSW